MGACHSQARSLLAAQPQLRSLSAGASEELSAADGVATLAQLSGLTSLKLHRWVGLDQYVQLQDCLAALAGGAVALHRLEIVPDYVRPHHLNVLETLIMYRLTDLVVLFSVAPGRHA